MTTYIYAKQFYFEDEVKGTGYLAINQAGKFGQYTQELPADATEVIDYSSYSIAPGLVDTHIHGFYGFDVMDQQLDGLQTIATTLPSCGVTSYLPTTLTASEEDISTVCQLIANHHQMIRGSKIQGIFLEGPFLSPAYKGAQNATYMQNPNTSLLQKWQQEAGGLIKKVGIAPELEGAIPFIEFAKQEHVTTAIAHTSATYNECQRAVEAGANVFVHTFNGMSGLHHREPGTVGAAMTLPNAYVELICDGHHVHPIAAKILVEMVGPNRMVLVSDCMKAGGLGDGESKLGDFDVVVKDGMARLKYGGQLAGSVLQLMEAVQNIVKWGIATPHEALNMASINPAKSIGVEHLCGRILAGTPADFIVIDDELQLVATYIDGERYFSQAS